MGQVCLKRARFFLDITRRDKSEGLVLFMDVNAKNCCSVGTGLNGAQSLLISILWDKILNS